ncbi:hypothetical protein RclHR1_16170003 [Rhizophagus clarus]|uniref:Uncharacterized protein n=1 Tax=Rhizophagus clarus TaxID=94130 RepID=A0A2Z6QXP8_9GLOM|nr:hypothetical protein RclHR1_16170003 [Rhizophagus clarus]GET01686.1 hypothetical protein GLOIN_2v1837079 [Rhizophagus clarus]
MVTYGYLIGKNIETFRLFVPHRLNKIQLTPSRSRFIVMGTKDSIFDWMEYYERLVCEFSSLQLDHTTAENHLRFELHDDEEQHHCCNIIRKLFSNGTKKYNGSSKMRLEISIHNNIARNSGHVEQLHQHYSAPVMEANCKSGTRLLNILNEWYDYRISNNNKFNYEQLRKICDYEI